MIEVKNIKKSYGTLQVLKGIDLIIPEKQIVTIVGASGAGKSTLLHIIGTLDYPDEGEVWYEQDNVAHYSASFRGTPLIQAGIHTFSKAVNSGSKW